mgnify:CR=1 FL=1
MNEKSVCKIFSRSNRDITESEKIIIQNILKSKKPFVKSFILDGELIAVDKKDGSFIPYVLLQSRRNQVTEFFNF